MDTDSKQSAATDAQRPRSVARIVFIDKENCCECTRTRTEATWAALEESLGAEPLQVERIHIDTQSDRARAYLDKRPVMVIPGVYFLDAEGRVLELLQGEVSGEQFAKSLSG